MSDHDPVLREHGYHSLRIARVVTETHDASSFVLDVPAELAETFRYRPGQFCTFRVHIDRDEHLRSYSMSSAPETDGALTVTVKRVAGGLVSNWLLDNLAEGDLVEATKPAGVFCPQESERPVLGFCGGSGITPVMSIAKHVLSATRRPVRLLYANRDRDSVIFDAALTRWAPSTPTGCWSGTTSMPRTASDARGDRRVRGRRPRRRFLHLRPRPLHGSRRIDAADARCRRRPHLH